MPNSHIFFYRQTMSSSALFVAKVLVLLLILCDFREASCHDDLDSNILQYSSLPFSVELLSDDISISVSSPHTLTHSTQSVRVEWSITNRALDTLTLIAQSSSIYDIAVYVPAEAAWKPHEHAPLKSKVSHHCNDCDDWDVG